MFLQSDGNVIVRRSNNQAIWTSQTYDHAGAHLVVDDGGRIAVTEGSYAIWLNGIPRGKYVGPPAANLEFPVRGIFYYPVRNYVHCHHRDEYASNFYAIFAQR